MLLTANLIENYLRQHDDQWPSSWDELHSVKFEKRPPSMYVWPRDSTEVVERVHVDFDVTANQLADPSFQVTSVIAPIGDYWYDPMIRLQTLQDYIDSRREEGAFTPTD